MTDTRNEPRWPASLALVVCAALYIALPSRLCVGPRWILPVLVLLPLIPLSMGRHRHFEEPRWVRPVTIGLIFLIHLANMISTGLLVNDLLTRNVTNGRALIFAAALVWLTNVIAFGLWLWEVDRGGPSVRGTNRESWPDIQFPQLENPTLAPAGWRPRFWDYLYSSFANGTSFAPADAMPLTFRAKALFASESLVSVVTLVVVAARAVNIFV
jgi:uncharacterized membrane protein